MKQYFFLAVILMLGFSAPITTAIIRAQTGEYEWAAVTVTQGVTLPNAQVFIINPDGSPLFRMVFSIQLTAFYEAARFHPIGSEYYVPLVSGEFYNPSTGELTINVVDGSSGFAPTIAPPGRFVQILVKGIR